MVVWFAAVPPLITAVTVIGGGLVVAKVVRDSNDTVETLGDELEDVTDSLTRMILVGGALFIAYSLITN